MTDNSDIYEHDEDTKMRIALGLPPKGMYADRKPPVLYITSWIDLYDLNNDFPGIWEVVVDWLESVYSGITDEETVVKGWSFEKKDLILILEPDKDIQLYSADKGTDLEWVTYHLLKSLVDNEGDNDE